MLPKELLELKNEFSKVTGYKISIQKFYFILIIKKEKDKVIPFIKASKRIK